VYSLIALETMFATKMFDPDTAMATGPLSPEMSEALTVAPDVVYSPIVSVPTFVTKMSEPDTARPPGSLSPEMSGALTVAPEVVYSPTVPGKPLIVAGKLFATKMFDPDTAMASGSLSPEEMSEALTVVPEVVYSPIVPPIGFVTKISEPCAPWCITSSRLTMPMDITVRFKMLGLCLQVLIMAILLPLPVKKKNAHSIGSLNRIPRKTRWIRAVVAVNACPSLACILALLQVVMLSRFGSLSVS
jgi:hypothetical protein